MNDLKACIALLGGLVLVLGLGSKPLASSPIPPTLLALLIGMAVGPRALNLIDLKALGDQAKLLETSARLALGMPMMWVISAALVHLILGLPFWMAALIGAVITPAETNIPERIRHAVSFDSRANDGLAYLFVFLPMLMLAWRGSPSHQKEQP